MLLPHLVVGLICLLGPAHLELFGSFWLCSCDTRNAGEDRSLSFFFSSLWFFLCCVVFVGVFCVCGFLFLNQPCQYWCSMAPKDLDFFA